MPVTQEQVLEALRKVMDPDLHRDIVTLGFVKDIRICDGNVAFRVELTTPACPVKDQLKSECVEVVSALEGVHQVEIEMTAQVRSRESLAEDLIPGVKQCIAIASGKGGVGKSTLTVNLALALAQQGARVGVLDADIYGPSIPMMLGCPGERPFTRNGRIIPVERFGVRLMSMDFLLEPHQAVAWRGPMVAKAVAQFLVDVDWGELDYLLVDLPPGTGDASMTLADAAPLTGVVIVTTPHQVAANIAAKAASLFRQSNTAILGVIENMGEFVCPSCHTQSRLFRGLTGQQLAHDLGVPYLGSIPLDPLVSESADKGVPAVIAHPEQPQALAFKEVASQLAAQSSIRVLTKTPGADLNKAEDESALTAV